MEMFKKHLDTIAILSTIIGTFLWMNTQFNAIDRRFAAVDVRFAEIEKNLAVLKTILIMKDICPKELVHGGETK